MSKNQKKKAGNKRVALIILIVVLAVILVTLIAGTVFVTGTLNRINRPVTDETLSQAEIDAVLNENEDVDENFTGEILSSDDVTLSDTPVDAVAVGDDTVSIMLVGQDARDTKTRSRSDSMILCTIDKSTATLTMTSFMRDTYVRIPGYFDQRLNVAYMLGGFETLYDTLEYSFGVQVDQGVAVNFFAFKEIIDTVGGVDIELTAAEANHLNGQNYTWGLYEGVNRLYGDAALAYARIRKVGSGGDFTRTNRQRTVIMALLEKAKEMPLTDLYNLVDTLIPMISTDMSNAEIIGLVMELAPLLSDLTVVSQRIPVDDGYNMTMIDGMSVLLPDLEINRQFLIDTIGQE